MEEVKEVQKQGKTWKNSAYKATFEEADAIRIERLLEPGTEAKVKWLESENRFVVKVRRDPIIEASEKLFGGNAKKKGKNKKKGKRK